MTLQRLFHWKEECFLSIFCDILIFLTGREEIDKVVEEIYDRGKTLPKNSLSVMPLPLYAGLTVEEQLQVFEPTPKYTRKVIVSTNIAEASVTLDGVVYVIDTGFVKPWWLLPSLRLQHYKEQVVQVV
ncbi:uncharacterized protein B0P05DRAFT_229953 [Gilbertella persicaria]|uniref:uncharacterized protein n=1 Tax=Gilbertella persicaria TaxID=101096 RepID=UPI00221EC2E2|nr:uncharacterized protein B0P05DRAFT_229953 [Gilbertella persicaria]KAI8064827.1 hypothetical protein B0P05DRAFT_229953 [Gilbertella persicaria]